MGEETCPSTGRKHLQGFVHLKNPWRIRRIKEAFGNGIHLENACGTDEQSREYCRKEGHYFELGAIPEPKRRRGGYTYTADDVAEEIMSGTSLMEVQTKYPGAVLKWWDLNDDEEDVVIDDFHGWIPYDEMPVLLY